MSAHIILIGDRRQELSDIQPEKQFRLACQRVVVSGQRGEVICPDGRRFDITQDSPLARLVRKMDLI